VSAARQFAILSSRNIKICHATAAADLMLASRRCGLLDVVLSLIMAATCSPMARQHGQRHHHPVPPIILPS